MNVATISAEGANARIGANAGVSVDFRLHKYVGLQTGLYYSLQGYKTSLLEEYRGMVYNEKNTANLHYLKIPVLVGGRFDFNTKVPVQLQVNTGPYIAFAVAGKLKATAEVTYEGDTEKETETYNLFEKDEDGNSNSNRFDIGWSIGTSVIVKKFYVGLAYDFGFVNTIKDIEGEKVPSKNGVFSLSVGYNF